MLAKKVISYIKTTKNTDQKNARKVKKNYLFKNLLPDH